MPVGVVSCRALALREAAVKKCATSRATPKIKPATIKASLVVCVSFMGWIIEFPVIVQVQNLRIGRKRSAIHL